MDKALLTKQLEIVKGLPPGKPFAFTLEGAGVLKAFVQSRANLPDLTPGERALHTKIRGLLATWEESGGNSAPASSEPGKDKRTQLALREAIDKTTADKFASITREEIKLLQATHDVFCRRSQAGASGNNRLRDLLKTTLDKLEANRDKLAPAAQKTIFDTTSAGGVLESKTTFANDIMADKAFKDIQKTSMARVEEIDLDINVRVFSFKGDTRISGDIPNDVLVKVEKGDLHVYGFVAGYVVADQDIHIAGNMQGGGAISNFGSIALERSLMGAILVAKRGNVTCDHLESPRWAFAWEKLTVNGPCVAGSVTAGAITVHGKVVAATLHSCGHIVAEEFGVSSRADTVVYLSNVIKCDAYNRTIPESLEDRFRQIMGLQRTIAKAAESDAVMLRFINNLYRTGLFFLLGGVESANTAQVLQGKQIRALYFGQIISFGTGVSKFYHDAQEMPEEYGKEVVEDFDADSRESLTAIQKDIENIPEEFGDTHKRYLRERLGELRGLMKMICREHLETGASEALEWKLSRRLKDWRTAYSDLESDVRDMISDFGLERDVLERIEHEPEGLEDMLQKTLNAKLASTDSDEVQRAKSPLINLLRRSAERSKRFIENSLNVVERSHRQINQIVEDLEKAAAVKFAPHIPSATLVRGNRFAPEVIITASPIARSGRDTNFARVIVLREPITQETVFLLKDKMIQRVISS